MTFPEGGYKSSRRLLATLAVTTLLAVAPTLPAEENVYRCEGPDSVNFSDRPCGPSPETITIRDNRVGGSLGDNMPDFSDYADDEPEPESQGDQEDNSPCRYINSTNLRTYLARNQVVPGMTREQVEQSFGRTSEVYPTPQETWVYQTRHYGALYELTYVYFQDGCVERVEYREP